MNKKLLLIPAFILIFLFANSLTSLEYDMNLIEYMTSDTSLSQEEINYLSAHSNLIYGGDYNTPPLRYVNEATGEYEGLVIDYLRTLSIELGIPIEFRPLVWNDALESLSQGQTDLCDMYPSEARSEKYLFSEPIYYQRGVIAIRKSDANIHSLSDLSGKTIASSKGDYSLDYITEKFDQINGVETSDLQEALELLASGQVDVVCGDESVINYFITKSKFKNECTIFSEYLFEREIVLATHKDNPPLLKILNKGINNLNKKKTMDMIYKKWLGISPLITKSDNYHKMSLIIRYALILAFIIGTFLYSWNLQLKNEVKRQTANLRFSKKELETVFNGLTHPMIVIDEDCTLKDANKAYCSHLNCSKEELQGQNCLNLNGIIGTDCNTCPIRETFDNEGPVVKEMQVQGNTYKVCTYNLESLSENKRRTLLLIEDITKIKITEQTMLQSNKMAAVGQLAAGIAHEVRTPLGIIRNHCYFIKRNPPESEKDESITIIESSVARANKIIDNLLNFSRLTDNRITDTNIYTLITNIYSLSQKSLKKNNISFHLDCHQDLNLMLQAESLKHVLINLINNAIDAMEGGGHLHICAKMSDGHLLLEVSDTGVGIDDHDLDNIFNPFFTTKEIGSGTGLGLYITYNEVQKMNGQITVSSKPDAGTTFTISIPNTQNSKIQEG